MLKRALEQPSDGMRGEHERSANTDAGDAGASSSATGAAAGESGEAKYRDTDGAIYFDGSGEGRDVRLPPGVPIPSADMIRRHKAAGHVPRKLVLAVRVQFSKRATSSAKSCYTGWGYS